jgi:hypothetical protein
MFAGLKYIVAGFFQAWRIDRLLLQPSLSKIFKGLSSLYSSSKDPIAHKLSMLEKIKIKGFFFSLSFLFKIIWLLSLHA